MLQLPQDPDLPGLNGCTALRRASRAGRCRRPLLLEAGANLDLASVDGCTALMRACGAKHLEIVRLLLEAGADKDAADNGGRTAWHWALVAGDAEILHLLLRVGVGTLKDLARIDGCAALMPASTQGHVEIVAERRCQHGPQPPHSFDEGIQ